MRGSAAVALAVKLAHLRGALHLCIRGGKWCSRTVATVVATAPTPASAPALPRTRRRIKRHARIPMHRPKTAARLVRRSERCRLCLCLLDRLRRHLYRRLHLNGRSSRRKAPTAHTCIIRIRARPRSPATGRRVDIADALERNSQTGRDRQSRPGGIGSKRERVAALHAQKRARLCWRSDHSRGRCRRFRRGSRQIKCRVALAQRALVPHDKARRSVQSCVPF